MTVRTPEFGWPSPEGTDPADGPAQFKALAEAQEATVKTLDPKYLRAGTSGQLIIVSGTGAPAYAAMRGDATIIADGTFAIGDDKVIQRHIGPQAVGVTELADDTVGQSKLQDNSVGSAEIAANAVGNGEMADNSIGAPEIISGAVGTDEIAALAVLEGELADRAVTSRKFKPTVGSVLLNADTTLTGVSRAFVDLPGAVVRLTPSVASNLIVIAYFQAFAFNAGGRLLGRINAGAAGNSDSPVVTVLDTALGRNSVVRPAVIPLTASVEHTIKLQATNDEGVGNALRCEAGGSGFTYILVAQ